MNWNEFIHQEASKINIDPTSETKDYCAKERLLLFCDSKPALLYNDYVALLYQPGSKMDWICL